MPHDDQRPTLVHISFRFVDVNDKALIQSRCVNRIAVFDVVRDIKIFERRSISIAGSVAVINLSVNWNEQQGGEKSHGRRPQRQGELFHL